MVFSSYLFLFYFLPVALALYYVVPRRAQHLALTALSYAFYGWANPLFVPLLLGSTIIDYACGRVIGEARAKGVREDASGHQVPVAAAGRRALAVSIGSNLALLGFFKYFNFGVDSYDSVVQALGLEALRLDLAIRVTLPLGISFYTFQSMSYSWDIYRGRAMPLRSFVDFACYVSMFPQLVAGPIIRFSEVADQLRSRTHTVTKFARGVAFFSVGLAKKVLLANPCGKVADLAFDAGSLHALEAWYGATAYAFQIYFDFSGYSDMAIGLGLMLGFVFPKNFDSPYRARSITEFWRRWHISLSTWLRDYLYLPLGGNRKGPTRTYVNLFVVMLLGGLWHGAAWTFVAWGALHGALLGIERRFGGSPGFARVPAAARIVVTFTLVLVGWVFFRSASLVDAVNYLRQMFALGAPHSGAVLLAGIIYQPYYLGTMTIAAVVVWACPQTWHWTRELTWPRASMVMALFVLSVMALTTQAFNPFIYFIF